MSDLVAQPSGRLDGPAGLWTYFLWTAGIYAVVTVLSVGERARSFKAISPGLLSPLGIIFGLFVSFTAAQVGTDDEKARTEVGRETSALRQSHLGVKPTSRNSLSIAL